MNVKKSQIFVQCDKKRQFYHSIRWMCTLSINFMLSNKFHFYSFYLKRISRLKFIRWIVRSLGIVFCLFLCPFMLEIKFICISKKIQRESESAALTRNNGIDEQPFCCKVLFNSCRKMGSNGMPLLESQRMWIARAFRFRAPGSNSSYYKISFAQMRNEKNPWCICKQKHIASPSLSSPPVLFIFFVFIMRLSELQSHKIHTRSHYHKTWLSMPNNIICLNDLR